MNVGFLLTLVISFFVSYYLANGMGYLASLYKRKFKKKIKIKSYQEYFADNNYIVCPSCTRRFFRKDMELVRLNKGVLNLRSEISFLPTGFLCVACAKEQVNVGKATILRKEQNA